MRIREPKNQAEIDRNLLIICWLLILPSIALLYRYNGYLLALLLVGGFSRLLVAAIRLPSGERGYFRILIFGLSILSVIIIRFEILGPFVYLPAFWIFLGYSDYRFFRFNRSQEEGGDAPGGRREAPVSRSSRDFPLK